MLQTATVTPGTLELLGNLQGEPLLRNTRLVGGTALSLQIGRRKSEDRCYLSSVSVAGRSNGGRRFQNCCKNRYRCNENACYY